MGEQFENEEDDEARSVRRKQRIAEMKKQKEQRELIQQYIRKYGMYVGAFLVMLILIGVGISSVRRNAEAKGHENAITATEEVSSEENSAEDQVAEGIHTLGDVQDETSATETLPGETEESIMQPVEPEPMWEDVQVGDVTFWGGYTAESNADTVIPAEDVCSEYAILMDAGTGTIIAQKDAKVRMNPASMTKVLTVLVAAEHVTDWDDTFTMNLEITDYAYTNDCSSVGFLDQEVVTVRDLFYGTILPSGGDAALALATYVAGSHEAFVEMMNDKLEELGLSETAHFTNCVGLYDEDHYCTAYDMAMIMKAAVENDLCREVMSTRIYTTSLTEQHPEGITVSNWFIRRIEDKDAGGKVICAKTGYVAQSGSCAVSYCISEEGTPYICVTAQTYSSWRCIYDHVALYKKYTPN